MSNLIDKHPKVFISYSWANENTVNFTSDLAERLVQHGVDVIWDKWSLQEGQDKYAFMERSVNDDSISHVLLICDKAYTERANARHGGVGDETTVITPEIYGNANQTKFIPILFERDDSGNEYLPTYIKARIYIDFSNALDYESSYEQLLRCLYDKPICKKPPLGKTPAWLAEDSVNYNELNALVKKNKNLPDSQPHKFQELKMDFTEIFINILNEMRFLDDKFDAESLLKKIDSLKPIRDIYFDFLIATINSSYFSSDFVKEFFENLYNRVPTAANNGYSERDFEYYDFLVWESFIGTITLLWQYEKYSAIYDLVSKKYFLRDNLFSNASEKIYSFVKFRKYLSTLEEDCQRNFQQRYVSYASKLLIGREKLPYLNKYALCDTDLRLYHLSTIILEPSNGFFKNVWFPSTYCYLSEPKNIWQRLVSRSYCDKILPLFGVRTISELKSLFSNINQKQLEPIGYRDGFYSSAPNILAYINITDIATLA